MNNLIVIMIFFVSSTIGPSMPSSETARDNSETENVPVSVTRRPSADHYTLAQDSTTHVCNEGDNTTYLVTGNQCIRDNLLINGKIYHSSAGSQVIPNFSLKFTRMQSAHSL